MTLRRLLPAFALLSLLSAPARAEDGHDGWLRYAPLDTASAHRYGSLPTYISYLRVDGVSEAAAKELARGLTGMLHRPFHEHNGPPPYDKSIRVLVVGRDPAIKQSPEGFTLKRLSNGYAVYSPSTRGELYGVFRLMELVAEGKPLPEQLREDPAAPIRWVNQWDNFDGSIERGYAGRSIFFDAGHVRADLTRVSEYGRLLASIGINGVTVNNVNANPHTLDSATLQELARIADALRPWGVRMSLSIPFASPQIVDGLDSSDPVDPKVAAWWRAKVDEIYKLVPDFGGFLVKADSEGQPGPSQYRRTPADYANVLANALAPHHGLVLYRGFVYNHHLDWHDLKADRARAGYDNFRALDGKFAPNVVIQVKHGPIDFQVREPVSPLFAALQHTSQAIELQTTQEYTGQQRHMVWLVPMWKWALDTDMRAQGRATPVKEIVEGKSFHQPTGGFVSVVNVGLDTNWLHHPLAMANLYGFGRLAWNPDLSSKQIIDAWTRLTFGNDPQVVATIDALQLESWQAYEQYTGPLGIGTLTDILGVHFGPDPGSAENNGWGQWFRADHDGVGMDRTVATGTGYIGQYPPQLARVYESLDTCPDDLLLFMHHVPYTHRLHNGETVIQYMYDAHYSGAATAATYVKRWQTLRGRIDDERYDKVLRLFTYQAGHAIVWRDAVNTYFAKLSGIADDKGRVLHFPNRIEAENMHGEGYQAVNATPPETASGGRAAVCTRDAGCTLTVTLQKPAGMYWIAVQYFDIHPGTAHFELLLNNQPVAHWDADDILPPAQSDTRINGHSSTRFTTPPLALKPGDELVLRAKPDGEDRAAVDYIELDSTEK
jgi:alpha-glucuronidase